MPWIYRAKKQEPPHVCELPALEGWITGKPKASPGDKWECPDCHKQYIVLVEECPTDYGLSHGLYFARLRQGGSRRPDVSDAMETRSYG